MTDRVWAEVSESALVKNFHTIKDFSQPAALIPVVKSNAYGHGAIDVVRILEREGAERFAVATPDEAIELRSAGVKSDILILGYVSPDDAVEMLENNVTLTVLSEKHAYALSSAVCGLSKKLKVHIAVDTGMSRLGFKTEPAAFADSVSAISNITRSSLDVEGIFTHFAVSEAQNDSFNTEQISRFTSLLSAVGSDFRIVHMSNSGAILNVPNARFDAVRPGIILYGVYPDPSLENTLSLEPVMSLRTRLVQIHDYTDPVTISYGRRFASNGPMRVGTVSIGYADGLHRALSGKMDMLIRGKRAPQIGSICMDMCMIDLSNIPEAEEGDVVTIFGRDGSSFNGVSELAAIAGTIPYELTCALSRRVKQILVD